MHAALGFQPAIGIDPADLDGRRFEPGALAGALFEPLDLVAMRLGPAHIHPQQHLGPILRLGAAGAGMDFEISVVAVGLARQQAFELALLCLVAQLFEVRLGFGDDLAVALAFAELDQLQRLIDLALDAAVALDRALQPGALAQDRLRRGAVVPQLRVFGLAVQLFEAGVGDIPVKDASSAAPATS
jgi:hypothetical protein